jgi:uncharacterized protein
MKHKFYINLISFKFMEGKLIQKKIIYEIQKRRNEIQKKFGVKKLYLFGSYARGEENEISDIDILVEFERRSPKNDFKLLKLGLFLEKYFKKEVDIGEKKDIKKEYLNSIVNNNLATIL